MRENIVRPAYTSWRITVQHSQDIGHINFSYYIHTWTDNSVEVLEEDKQIGGGVSFLLSIVNGKL